MKPNFTRKNWYGFNHNEVNKKFDGGLTFLNSFCIYDEYDPVTVYKVKNPNKAKGHKKYLLLYLDSFINKLVIRGMSPYQMNKEKYRSAALCLKCNDLIFSANRHNMCSCSCYNISVDGGKDYFSISYQTPLYRTLTVDLLTGKEKLTKKQKHNNKFNEKIEKLIK